MDFLRRLVIAWALSLLSGKPAVPLRTTSRSLPGMEQMPPGEREAAMDGAVKFCSDAKLHLESLQGVCLCVSFNGPQIKSCKDLEEGKENTLKDRSFLCSQDSRLQTSSMWVLLSTCQFASFFCAKNSMQTFLREL